MFGTLIESRAVHQRHTGSSLASILIHSAIVTAGVIAGAKDFPRVIARPEPVTHPIPFFRQVDPPPAPARREIEGANSPVGPSPIIRRIDAPLIIPVGIPAVDWTATPTPIDFRSGPIQRAGICEGDCGPSPLIDGRQPWSTSDLFMRLLDDPVPPRYPESLRRAGVEGDVVVKFIVDTTGRVDLRSIEVMRATHDAFVDAVRETLSRLRFAPATAGERKVPALAVMPFHFTLR